MTSKSLRVSEEDIFFEDPEAAEKKRLLVNDETGGVSEDDEKIYYEAFLVVMPVFSGYACLFALQRKLKEQYGIADNGSELSHLFGVAASLVYIGNLCFRLMHNVIFFYFSPRARVIISMLSMGLSMLTITSIFFFIDKPSLTWAFIAYGLGGLAIGTFESNLLSSIAPLGKKTKLWAIIAIPTGIIFITVGGFILTEYGVNAGYIYAAVMVFVFIGLGVFLIRIFKDAGTATAITITEFVESLRDWRHWLPQIIWHSFALTLDMFFVSLFSPGVLLYIYDSKNITLTWIGKEIPTNWLFAMYDFMFFLGDTSSRKIFYPVRLIFPFMFWVFSLAGAAIGLSHVTILVPLTGFSLLLQMEAFTHKQIVKLMEKLPKSTV